MAKSLRDYIAIQTEGGRKTKPFAPANMGLWGKGKDLQSPLLCSRFRLLDCFIWKIEAVNEEKERKRERERERERGGGGDGDVMGF